MMYHSERVKSKPGNLSAISGKARKGFAQIFLLFHEMEVKPGKQVAMNFQRINCI